jgi:hypothetical protein
VASGLVPTGLQEPLNLFVPIFDYSRTTQISDRARDKQKLQTKWLDYSAVQGTTEGVGLFISHPNE